MSALFPHPWAHCAEYPLVRPASREAPYTPTEAAALDHLSTRESLLEASRDKTIVLVILRHFGCTFTREILKSLQNLQADADRHGARLVLVHRLQQGREEDYRGR